MTTLMLGLGTPEILVILLVVLGIPFAAYYVGKKSGYKQGQLDMYKKRDEEAKQIK